MISGPKNSRLGESAIKADNVVKGGRFVAHKIASDKISSQIRVQTKRARVASLSPSSHE